MIYGKGINDKPEIIKSNRRLYDCWHQMLRRCYAKEWLNKHPTYIGCYVCNRWLLFSNFIEDIKLLDNYDKWIENKERYELDKDIKSNGTNKCYCPENCMFVLQKDNVVQANKTSDYNKISEKLKGRKMTDEQKQKMIKTLSDGRLKRENHHGFNTGIKIAQYDIDMNLIKIWINAERASEKLNIDRSSIRKCCQFWSIDCNKEKWFEAHKERPHKTAGGFIWKYFEEEK